MLPRNVCTLCSARSLLAGLLLCLGTTQAQAETRVEVAGLFKDKAVVVINGKQRVLRVGTPSPEGVVLISSTSKQAVLEIDGEQRTFTLGERISGTYSKPDQTRLQLWPDRGGHYIKEGLVNGTPVMFVVDTGATHISLNEPMARRIGLDYKQGRQGTSSTASGLSTVYLITLDTVQLGPIEEKNVRAVVHEGAFPEIALLGNSFLDRLNLKREGEVLELITK